MQINKLSFFEINYLLSMILCLMSEILFFKIGSTVVPWYMFLSVFSLLSIFLKYPKVIFIKRFFIVYIWFFLMLILSVIGVFVSGDLSNLAQNYIYVIIPITFIYFGYLIKVDIIFIPLKIILIFCTFFSVSQFLNFSFGIDFFGIFSYIADYMRNKQVMMGVEEIGARATGIFVNPNALGLYGGVSLFLFLFKRHLDKTVKNDIYIILSLICVLLSISRTSIIGIFLGLGFVYLLKFKKISVKQYLKSILYIVLGFLGLSYFFNVFSNEYYQERLLEIESVFKGDYSQSTNLEGRFDAWINIVKDLEKYPMGTLVPPQLVLTHSPDSQFIYFYAQGGFVLLISLIILFFSLILTGYYKNKEIIGCIIFVVFSSFTLVAFNTFIIALFWLMLGLIYNPNFYSYSKKPGLLRF